jgi:hypothetical protein
VAKHKIVEAQNASGQRIGWTVVDLPSSYQDGDLNPKPQASDAHFRTKELATHELNRRLGQSSCQCGCGEYPTTPGARFMPGHDVRKAHEDRLDSERSK